MCFCFNGDNKLSENVGFNSNIKDGVDGDELLQVSNLVCTFFIYGLRFANQISKRDSVLNKTYNFVHCFTEFLLLLSRVTNMHRFEKEKENANDAASNRK